MFQNADSVDLDDFLYARKLDGALQYQFNVIQVDSGVNQIITKDDNYFSLLELENNEAYYDKEYRIKVRAIFEEDTADWGGETVLKTIDEQMYKFGKVRLHFKQEHFEEYSSFKIRNNVLANNYIPNFNELSSISNIFEYGFPIKNILQKLHKDPYSCIDLQFDKKFSVDSIVNYFNSTQLCEFVVPIYNVTLSVDPVDYSTVDENCWHLTDVSAPDAWDITTGSSTTLIAVLDNTFNIDHEDIRDNIFINIEEIPLGVIILDYNGNGFIDADDLLTYSGYGTLRELFDAQPSNIFNLSDDSGNLIADDIIGWDCGDGDNNILPEHSNGDYYNHGTSVCHVAGGVTNNNNSGIASLSHNTRIIPIKLASDESDYTMNSSYDPLVALNYLISLNEKPDVISMSFTTGTDIPLFEATLNLFYSEFNTISIAAVGNDGAVINESNPMYPACYNNVVAVGATNSDNEIADFSNHGSIQNTYVLAPGQDIYTARAGIPFGINDSYDYVDGTSFSAPLVSALASLIYSYNPNVTAETVREAIECGCQNNTIQMNDYSPDDHGYGKVNAYQSLLCIQNMAPVANIEEEFDFYCPGHEYSFQATSLTTLENLTFLWTIESDQSYSIVGSTLSNVFQVIFNETGEYNISVTISSAIGSNTQEILVSVANPNINILNGANTQTCEGSNINIFVQMEGVPPFTFDYTFNGETNTFNNILTNQFHFELITSSLSEETTHNLTIDNFHDNICIGMPAMSEISIAECNICGRYNQVIHPNIAPPSTEHWGLFFNPNPQVIPNPYDPDISDPETSASISDFGGIPILSVNNANVYSTSPSCFNEIIASGVYYPPVPAMTNQSARQGSLILPNPDNPMQYFIILIGSNSPAPIQNRTVWGIVDFTTNPCGEYFHMGEFVSNSAESLAACRIDGANGYWIVTSGEGEFVFYKITAGMMEYSGSQIIGNNGGPIIFSQDMNYLARRNSQIELFSFNRDISFSGDRLVSIGSRNIESIQGMEFSANNEYLYITTVNWSAYASFIHQYTLSDFATCIPVQITQNNTMAQTFRDMRLGPDNKIYVLEGGGEIGVIVNPDDSGNNVNYSSNAFYLDFGTCFDFPPRVPTSHINFNLVNQIDNCVSEIVIDNLGGDPSFSYEWNTGDITESLFNVEPGTYEVTVTSSFGCTASESITVDYTPLSFDNIETHSPCSPETDGYISVTVIGGTPPYLYYWEDENEIQIGEVNNATLSNLGGGSYYLTVMDDTGCEVSTTYTIYPSMPPELEFINIVSICNTVSEYGSAQVNVTNGFGPFTYLWSSGETSQTATQLSAGTNWVTVTDSNDCPSIGSVEIGNLHVDATFKYYPCLDLNTIDLDLALFFPAAIPEADWPLYNFEWIMGNGQMENTPEVIPTYAYEGYYCPQLTVSRDGCVDTQQETIYVNPTGCYCNQDNWDYNNFVINGDNYPDILVQGSNGVSMSNQEIYILKEMIISNNRLTLNNCILHFGPEGRVIVEVGATLVSNSTVFTSFENGESCNHMWQGIEVRGTNGTPADQGEVIFGRTGSSSEIKNAHIGILSGKRNLSYICNCPSGNPFSLSASGGMISANNTNFINNGTDIKFTRSIVSSNNNSLSSIRNCNFTCYPELLDEGYDINYPNHYGFGEPSNWQNPNNTFFNPRNPWAGRANELQRSNASIWVHNQTFSNLIAFNTFDNKEDGIISYDSKYTVFDCHFTKMINGISIFNTDPFIDLNHEISLCEFDKIPNIPLDPDANGACIRIDGGMFDFIHDNTFGVLSTNQNLNDDGVRLTNASGFRIIENEFYSLKTGVSISESGNEDGEGGYVGAGLSTTHLNWTGNVYTQCRTNILTFGSNDNLKLKCNMCNNLIPDLFTVNFESSGTLANQGSMPYGTLMVPNNKRKFAAGNEFDGTPDPLNPFDDEPYFKEVHATNSYEYFHHTEPFMAIPVPTTTQITTHSIGYTKESNEISCPKPFLGAIVIDIDIIDDVPVDFDDSFDFTSTITSFNTTIESLEYDYNELELSLDKGNTLRLLSDIYNGAPQGKLKNDLISSSPLSDTVITALIVEYPLSHGNFKNVMQYNLPVSRDVSPYLNERLKTIPKGIANQLIPLMSENQFAVTPASIQRKIEYLNLEKQLYINEIIFRLLDTTINNKAAVVSLLEEIDTWSAKQLLFSDMLNNGDYSLAASFLSDFDRSNSEINDWVELNEILLSLYSNDKTLYEMDSTQLAFVTDLAYKCPSKRGSAGARSIIHMLFGEEVPPCVEMQSRNSKLMIRDVDFLMPDSDAYMEDNFPDPFTDYTLINYYLPEEMTGKIIVNDMFGRIISEYKLETGENTLEIINNDWAPGVYSYGMIVNDKAIEFKKMVITQ